MRGAWARQNEQVQARTPICSGSFESRSFTCKLPQ